MATGRTVAKRIDPAVLSSMWSDITSPDSSELDAVLVDWLDSELVVADVGARAGVAKRWQRFGSGVRVIGFDPDEAECERLTALEGGDGTVTFVPVALGSRNGTATLHLTDDPACSSLYRPLVELISHRSELSAIAARGTTTVTVSTLDDWLANSEFGRLDVLKLDTQGSELGVLEGATTALQAVRLLEVEVEFNEIYEAQPLFGDVDRFLRQHGFVLWRLAQLVHFGVAGVPSPPIDEAESLHFDRRPHRGGQLFWGHAYFVRKDMAFPQPDSTYDWQQAVRDACAAQAFGFSDLALSGLRRASTAAPAPARETLARLLEP